MFRQTKELPKEVEESPSEIPDSEVQREEEEFEPQIPDVLEESERSTEELLEAPPFERRPAWYLETVQEAEKHKAPPKTFKESIKPKMYSGLMSKLIDAEPSTYKEAASLQVWNGAMIEEYSSIMKNDEWEVVPKPTGKCGKLFLDQQGSLW